MKYYTLNVQIFFHILEVMKLVGSFLTLVYHLFYELEPRLLFYQPWGNWNFSMQDLNFFSKCFEMDSQQILTITILIISWWWAWLGSGSRIILAISWLLNDFDEITFSVLFENVEGTLLERFIKEHCSAKKELNISTFSFKSVIHLFCWLEGGIQGIVLLFKNIFKVDQ